MNEHSQIPDIFVIGAMKGGTSTLHRSILVHPEICRTNRKEVNFFLSNEPIDKISDRYRHQFTNASLFKCDVSPKYSQHHNYPGVAARIFAANPKAKIVYITRDPVERALSHLHHNLLRDRYSSGNEEQEIRKNSDYVMVSKYHFQINKYLEVFPKNQIIVLQLEELIKHPDVFCQKLSSFIGVRRTLENKSQKFNVSERRYKIKYYDFVHNHFSTPGLIKLYHYFWLFMNIKAPKPKLSEAAMTYLRDELRADVDLLASTFPIDLSLWTNFNRIDGTK